MDEFIKKNKGPLIAMGSAAIGLLLLIVISALANLPQASPTDTNPVNIWESVFWLILIGCLLSAIVLFVRERLAGSDTAEEEEEEEEEEQEILTLADTDQRLAEQIMTLFGTTDMNQITTGIQTMYSELEEHRAKGEINSEQDTQSLAEKVKEQESTIEAITNERDQARAALSKWQAKAVQGQKEISHYSQKLKKAPQPVEEEELTAFFATVTLKDGNSEDAFLNSKRRQRRLMQRLSAEGLAIMRSVE